MIVPNPFFVDRGFGVRVYNQVKGLKKLNHEILLICYNAGRNINDINVVKIPNILYYSEEKIGASLLRIYQDLILFFVSLLYTIKFKPKIIHAHLHEGALIGIFISKIFAIPVLLDAQGSLIKEIQARQEVKSKTIIFILKIIEKFIYQNVDFVITSSSVLEKIIINEFKINKKKVKCIPDCVDVQEFDAVGENFLSMKSKICEKFQIQQNKHFVIYLGTLQESYGIKYLLEAISYVKRKRKDIHFLICGGPEFNVKKYKNIASTIGISELVSFLGKIPYEETPKILSIAEVAVAPKLEGSEGNIKLFSYMAAGLPIVCFDTLVNREILKDYGIYAKVADPSSLAEKLVFIIENEGLRKELKYKVRQYVKENFSLDDIIIQLNEVYLLMILSGKYK